ncbi:thioredoxin family protein [Akkermansiaceae bacterium]|nr:thioredoxin family protein [bacterium]MDB4294317.1 thioredoxin family protein [Akkermansiaceae bacterium]MDB4820680.1 thioredoxin family protein [Akkermansiaceae bacterium]MDC1405759.1 thioredoxin family protein [Akkermansiaceae bacterium]
MALAFSNFTLKPGDAAPDFSLPDGHGELHHLSDLLGKNGTVIFFACNHCPFVVRLTEGLKDFANEMSGEDVATIAINSNDVENYPADSPDKMVTFAAESGWNFSYLYDESQEVAQAYDAACTPDFFLFDAEGKLTYAGRFDATERGSDDPVTGSDLRAAVHKLRAGEPSEHGEPSSGCGIKWKAGNEPSHLG